MSLELVQAKMRRVLPGDIILVELSMEIEESVYFLPSEVDFVDALESVGNMQGSSYYKIAGRMMSDLGFPDPSYGNVSGECDLVTHEIVWFDFGFVGEVVDGEYMGGVHADVENLRAAEVFADTLVDLYQMGIKLIENEREISSHSLLPRISRLVQWIAVYNYWFSHDTYDGDFDSGIEYVGRLESNRVGQAVVNLDGINATK